MSSAQQWPYWGESSGVIVAAAAAAARAARLAATAAEAAGQAAEAASRAAAAATEVARAAAESVEALMEVGPPGNASHANATPCVCRANNYERIVLRSELSGTAQPN